MSKKGQSIFSFSKANPYSSLFQDFLYHPLSSQACCCPLILKFFISFFPRDFSNLFPSPPTSPPFFFFFFHHFSFPLLNSPLSFISFQERVLFIYFFMSSIPSTHLIANSTNMVVVLLLIPREISYHSYPEKCLPLASGSMFQFCLHILPTSPLMSLIWNRHRLFLYSSLGDCTHPYILNCYLHIESFNSSPNFFFFLE